MSWNHLSRRETDLAEALLEPAEHKEAEELINELQDRVEQLQARKDSNTDVSKSRPWTYSPKMITLDVEGEKVVIKLGQGKTEVSHKGRVVVRIIGLYLDLINFTKFEDALAMIRRYMILDDLAAIE